MDFLRLLTIIGLSTKLHLATSINCYQEMNYHEKYGYGYDITCQKLNTTNIEELKNVTVYNEVRLSIENSNLTLTNSSELFENIPKTRQVVIRNSNVTLTGGPFYVLRHLEELTMTNSKLDDIPRSLFRGLDTLQILNFSSNAINRIENGTFRNLEGLTELDFSGNRLKTLEDIPICEMSQLKKLHLQHNRLEVITNSSLACLKLLKTLNLDFNRLGNVLNSSRLRYLNSFSLSYNYIEDLGGAFEGLENLEYLNLEGNQLKMIERAHFKSVLALRRLNVKRNKISAISLDAFLNLTNLEELDLSQNQLKRSPILVLPNLKRLDLSFNQFSGFNCELWQLPSLDSLYMQGCELKALKSEQFRSLTRLKSLDLSRNNVRITSTVLHGLHNLQELNLRFNSLQNLPNYAFNFVPNLSGLDLSNNQLRKLENLTFNGLQFLEILNLSYNHLEVLHESVVFPLKSLKSLDLEGNRLKFIDYDIIISLLKNLKLINIRENRLSCEFLSEMLLYFRSKRINFTINEKLNYNEENVAGIQCQEYDKFNDSAIMKHADSLLVNDTVVLNEIYQITKEDDKSLNASLSTTLLILVLIVLLLFISIVGISYRIYGVVKRRTYLSEEIELLDTRLGHQKWSESNNNNV